MNAKPKKKLCWNCEGATSLEEANCSYCGVYLHPSSISDNDDDKDLFNSPYKIAPETQQDASYTHSPFSIKTSSSEHVNETILSSDEQEPNDEDSSFSVMARAVVPLFLLLGGSLFFIFGIALMMFSKDGILTLHWNGDYWFLYLLVSVPMLFFGWIVSGRDDE